jgi:hypothetical protein
MFSRFPRAPALVLAGASLVALSLVAGAQTNGAPERFTAMAVNMNRGGATTVEIVINRWATDGERDRLLSTLMDKGPNKLLDVLQDMKKVGYIRTPDSIGYDLHYARRVPLPDGGQRVVTATDRPLRFWEVANQTRSVDYPFTVIELRVNADGEGEGKMSVATKITADKENNMIVLENYDISPVLLKSVKRERISQ